MQATASSFAALLVAASTCFAGVPRIVAHRGASHDAPENTLPAFELAWKQGADAIEGDFHLTADGRIICIHDPDTERVSGRKLNVKDSTLTELRALDAGAWFHPRWAGTRMPTFGEVAATVPPHGLMYIEIKCGPAMVDRLLKDIEASRLKTAQIVVISFHAPVIREIKRRAPSLKAFWLSSFKEGRDLDPSVESVLATLRETGADGFSSRADERVDASCTEAIRKAGFEYHCWTVDDPRVAYRFATLGARSITTNRPGLLRQHLLQGEANGDR